MKNKYRIVFYLSDEEYIPLKQRAEECNMGVNAYAKQKALDETDNVKLRRGVVSTMATLYYWAEQTTDLTAREYFRRGGDRLCQSLK